MSSRRPDHTPITTEIVDGVKWFSGTGAKSASIDYGRRAQHSLFVHVRRTPDRYASFRTKTAFVDHYRALTPEERTGYCEVIPLVSPVRLYFDVEWTSERATEDWHDTVDAINGMVRLALENMGLPGPLPRLDFKILFCGRWSDDKMRYKYSYHMKYQHLVFNCMQEMVLFLSQIDHMSRSESRVYKAELDNVRRVMDFKVYTGNQSLRMPWARKWRDAFAITSPACEEPDFWEHPELYLVTPIPDDHDLIDVRGIPMNRAKRQERIDRFFQPRPIGVMTTFPRPNVTPIEHDMIARSLLEAAIPFVDSHEGYKHWKCRSFEEVYLLDMLLMPGYLCRFCERVHERPAHHLTYYRRKQRVYFACYRNDAEATDFHDNHQFFAITMDPDMDPHIEPDAPIPVNEEYHEPRMRPYVFPDGKTTLLVEAQYGLGKTKKLFPYLAALPQAATVLFITNRIRLARKYASDFQQFGVQNYENLKGLPDTAAKLQGWRLATCYNSLRKFTAPNFSYDLVILDEITSVLPDTMGRYTAYDDRLLAVFGDTIQRAARVIALDADMARISYEFLAKLRGANALWVVRNSYRRPIDRTFTTLTASFEPMVIEKLRAGLRVVVASMSKAFTDKLFEDIQRALGGNSEIRFAKVNAEHQHGAAHNCPGFRADNLDTWQQLNCLIYSPSVGAGISFEIEHFDELFLYAWVCPETPTTFDVGQMLHRVRSLRNGNVYVYWARELTITDDKMALYPVNAADVMTKFERHDASVIRSLMPRENPPSAGLQYTGQDGRLNWDSLWRLDHWMVALYANIVMRRVRSLVQFRALLHAMLAAMGYGFANEDNRPEDGAVARALQQADPAAQERIRTKEEIQRRLPQV